MKISERKQRLRTRGVVPVSQEIAPRRVVESGPTRTRAKAGPAGKNAPAAPRSRWQPSPTYQIAFGAAYMIFSPILILNDLALANAPHSKVHPGFFEYFLPIVFFAFGAWWLYRGLQARRVARVNRPPMQRAANEAPSAPPAGKAGLMGLFRRPTR